MPRDPQAVAVMSAAICERRNAPDWPCNGLDFDDEMARAALAALAEAGMVVVPREPTSAAIHHGIDAYEAAARQGNAPMCAAYRAMLLAASANTGSQDRADHPDD